MVFKQGLKCSANNKASSSYVATCHYPSNYRGYRQKTAIFRGSSKMTLNCKRYLFVIYSIFLHKKIVSEYITNNIYIKKTTNLFLISL